MMSDIWTVMRKELKEIITLGGGSRGGKFSYLIVLGVFGVFVPWQSGRAWVESPMVVALWAWLPYFYTATWVADSFAGERERHTLETLLASRLSDRAILLGKLLAIMTYACGLVWSMAVIGLITVNVGFGQGTLLLYPPATAVAMVVATVLGSGLAASAGILISLRAATARQAAQTMSLLIFFLFIPIFGLQLLPAETQAQVSLWLEQADLAQIGLLAGGIVLVLDGVLLAAALARFQRARLILD